MSITGSAALISDPDGEVYIDKWLTLSDSTQYPTTNLQNNWEAPRSWTSSPFCSWKIPRIHRTRRDYWQHSQKNQEPGSGSVLYHPSLGLVLDNSSVRFVVGLRLGTPLCQPQHVSVVSLWITPGTHGLSSVSRKEGPSLVIQP